MDDATPERWLPVVGWEGLYEVSNKGQVKSLPRRTASGVRGGRILKPGIVNMRQIVNLRDCGHGKTRLVHRLVLEAFAGPCPDGYESLHGPGGSLDNRWPENLRWGTPVENAADKLRDGTHQRGERHGNHKLTSEQVLEIRRRYANGESQRSLAGAFGVTRGAIGSCVTGQNWASFPLRDTRSSRWPRRKGSAHPNAKLQEADVLLIRSVYAAGGMTQAELAARFGVTRGLIGQITRGAGWAHLS